MALSEFLFGKQGGFEQIPTMDPQTMQLLQKLIGGLGGATDQGFNFLSSILGGDTKQFEQPLMSQFYQQTIPNIAERFSGMGAGAQGSSAFTQSLGQAGAGLSEQLGSLRGQLGMQGLGHLQGLLGQGLNARSFETMYRPQQSGFIQDILGSILGGVGQAGSSFLTGGLSNLLQNKSFLGKAR